MCYKILVHIKGGPKTWPFLKVYNSRMNTMMQLSVTYIKKYTKMLGSSLSGVRLLFCVSPYMY